MEQSEFNEFYNNPQVIKINSHGIANLLYEPLNLVVCFTFFHRGIFEDETRRISLTTSSKEELFDLIHFTNISSRCIIMTNSDEPLYAIAYELLINSIEKTIILNIVKLPHLGQSLITSEELSGISLTLD